MEEILKIVAPIVALYGAVLSTCMYIKSIRSEKIDIFVGYGFIYDLERVGVHPPNALVLRAVNQGRRKAVITSLSDAARSPDRAA